MAMDSTMQIRMNSDLKEQVEDLYRSLGTSFAEAVRIFAQQSLRDGGLPFVPTTKVHEPMTLEELHARLEQSERDIAEGRVYSQTAVEALMMERYGRG